ncbi:unnamed protein product [Mytilus edulis]|uniref:B box-type domain-containing protein n=1 Tax=Mytilus edulis TaxID=6550 RepID=A0A8S3SH34_MYTED|nr:unnamed protein product [Mytilus edulis]
MAYALRPQSVRKAQVQKKCELCETDTKIQYRCVQCQKYMCEKCNKIHLNVQTSDKHEIINLRSYQDAQDTQTFMVTQNIPCDTHKKKVCVKCCLDCFELVCEDCIDKTHREHQLEEINEGCDDVIMMTQARLSKDLRFCESESKQLQRLSQMCSLSYDNAKKKIEVREKEINEAIKKYVNHLRAQLETNKCNVEKQRKTSEKKIKEIKEILRDKKSELKKSKENNRADKIITTIRDINNNLPCLDPNQLKKDQFKIDLKVVKSYNTEFKSVDRLLTLDHKTAWISNFQENTLSKINIDDNIRTVKNISARAFDISLIASKDILLTSIDSTDVNLLTTDTGEIKSSLSVSPLIPIGIHVTKCNEIILSVKEVGVSFKLTDKSCRKLIIFGMDGKKKQSYEYNKHKRRLFTFPERITSNENNDILVIDSKSSHEGRVVVLDKVGHIKWIYQGKSSN